MRNHQTLTAALLLILVAAGSAAAQQRDCLHGPLEASGDRARREQAVELAHAINRAEAAVFRPGQRGSFVPFEQLNGLPPTPEGFKVQFHLDASTYTFSLRDTLDPCRFAIFSDQTAYVYAANPSAPKGGVMLLPAK